MPEQQSIEWKVSWRDEFLRWICGFANAGGAFALGLAQSIGQNRVKHLEVNVLGQLFQGVSQAAQRGKPLAFIEKNWNVLM
jgi:ATP-dependent DNA helicase RecG